MSRIKSGESPPTDREARVVQLTDRLRNGFDGAREVAESLDSYTFIEDALRREFEHLKGIPGCGPADRIACLHELIEVRKARLELLAYVGLVREVGAQAQLADVTAITERLRRAPAVRDSNTH